MHNDVLQWGFMIQGWEELRILPLHSNDFMSFNPHLLHVTVQYLPSIYLMPVLKIHKSLWQYLTTFFFFFFFWGGGGGGGREVLLISLDKILHGISISVKNGSQGRRQVGASGC